MNKQLVILDEPDSEKCQEICNVSLENCTDDDCALKIQSRNVYHPDKFNRVMGRWFGERVARTQDNNIMPYDYLMEHYQE